MNDESSASQDRETDLHELRSGGVLLLGLPAAEQLGDLLGLSGLEVEQHAAAVHHERHAAEVVAGQVVNAEVTRHGLGSSGGRDPDRVSVDEVSPAQGVTC